MARRRLVSYVWSGNGKEAENKLVHITVEESTFWPFRPRSVRYCGIFQAKIFTGEWKFWNADDGESVDDETANRLGQMVLAAGMLDSVTA